jgi:ABC-type microcin C transport system permease subunit YejE
MMSSMPLPNSPRVMMTLVGPVIGVVSGAIIGLFALVFSRFVSHRKEAAV